MRRLLPIALLCSCSFQAPDASYDGGLAKDVALPDTADLDAAEDAGADPDREEPTPEDAGEIDGPVDTFQHYVATFLPVTLTSSADTISGTTQPSRLYSAMHCSANPLYRADAPVTSATSSVSKRMLS